MENTKEHGANGALRAFYSVLVIGADLHRVKEKAAHRRLEGSKSKEEAGGCTPPDKLFRKQY